jgi:GH18 family chitinase
MIPRVVEMAAEVAATFTTPQLEDYGNIILNGYATTGPNTVNQKAWQYKETTTAPVNLPSLTSVQPALKGWTNNYQEYYTQLQPNGYGVNPGDPTMFEFAVNSFTAQQGAVATLGAIQTGYGYTPGSYTGVATVGGSGTGATLDIVVGASGTITSVILNSPGSNYAAGNGLGVASPGPLGTGLSFSVAVASVTNVSPAGQPKWNQAPRRYSQAQLAPFVPPNNNPAAIQYSYMYPIANNLTAPPIGALTGVTPPPPPAIPTYTLSTTPTAATENTVISTTVSTTNVPDGTLVYWRMNGSGVTSSFFTSNVLQGTATVTSGSANFAQTLAASLPAGGPYTLGVTLYSNPGYTQQVGTTSVVISITPGVTPSTPELGVYIDLYQYRNTGGVYPDGSYVGLNPNMRAANINTLLPSLDKFYILLEAQIHSDGKLYFGTNVGNPAALVLNAAGTNWADNTGSVSGGYVSPTNPDYAYSAYAIKNSIYYLSQQSAWSTKNLMLSVGGYLLSQTMDQAGNSVLLAQTAADQIATLVQITGAVGVDLDYEPVGQPCIPPNMALLCQKIQTAVKALDPTYEVHLTIIPPLSQADPDLKISTALACQGYVDQINIMTYDDPNNLDQSPYQPGNATVYNHTGVGRSVQSVQWFLDQGVTRDKLGMGIAGYGRNSASGQAFTNNGTPYDQIVRIAGSGGAVDPQFMLGRLNAAVPIVNPNPTSQGNFYYSPTTAVWGFDSVDTIADKVQASSNLGIRAVFMWQLSNDYSNPASVLPAGNPLANFALVKGAQAAIAAL